MSSNQYAKLALRRLCFSAAMLLCVNGLIARAEGFSSDLRSRARELGEVYRTRAVEILQTYLDARRFYVDVEVVPKVSGVIDLPYVPKNKLSLGSNPNLMDDVQNLISSVRVVLKLPADITQQSQQQLQEILFKDLPLDRWRGDSVQLRTMHFAEPVPRAVEQAKPGVTEQRTAVAVPNAIRSQVADTANSGVINEAWKKFEPWMIPGLILVVLTALASMVAMMAFIKMLRVITRIEPDARKSIPRTRSRTFNRVPESAGRSNPQQAIKYHRQSHSPEAKALPYQTAGAIHSQLRNYREKLRNLFASNAISVSCAAELAARYLASEPENNKILAMLDLVPESTGHEIYSRLSTQQQRKIQFHAQQFVSGHQLSVLALEVGEELVSLIRSRALSQSESEHSVRIREFLSRTNDDELAKLLPAINVDVLPRMLFYFDPRRLTKILNLVKTTDGSFNNRLSWALLSLPAIEDKTELDQPIMNLLNAMQELVKRRESMRYFPQLKGLVDGLPEQMRRDIQDNLISLNQDFAQFMAAYASKSHPVESQTASDPESSQHPEWKIVA